MVTSKDITEFYKGEQVAVDLTLQDVDGRPIDTAGLVVSMVVSETVSGVSLWDTPRNFVLQDADRAEFRIVLDPTNDLDVLPAGKAQRYAIWSRKAGEPPVLRAAGVITLGSAISLPAA